MEQFFQDLFQKFFGDSILSVVWILVVICCALLTALIRGSKRYREIQNLLMDVSNKLDVLLYRNKDENFSIPNILKHKKPELNEVGDKNESLFE